MKNDKIKLLRENKKVILMVIKECKKKLRLSEMSYPGVIITNIEGYPQYSETIKYLKEICKNIDNHLKELSDY